MESFSQHLRLGLLIIGVIVIAGVYGYTRLSARRRRSRHEQDWAEDVTEPGTSERIEPVLGGGGTLPAEDVATPLDEATFADDMPVLKDEVEGQPETAHRAQPDLVLVLAIRAHEGRSFSGLDVKVALEEAGLCFGEFRIYHRHEGDDPRALFSVADMLEPGFLDPDELVGREVKGLTVFLQLPGPADGHSTFARMLDTARALADRLHGELCDSSRSVLTRQTITHYEEQITEYQRRERLRRG